jgi:ribosomal-protein-alanine N-acetyltransferase
LKKSPESLWLNNKGDCLTLQYEPVTTVVAITPRLLLRHWNIADVGSTDHIYGDAETMRYFGNGRIFTPAELAASFPRLIEDYTTMGYGNYAVVERATNKILGHCGARYIRERDRVEADWALGR